MTKIYHSSSGEKIIADMGFHNLAAAHAKLIRDYPPGSVRQPEIDAMAAELARRAEIEAEQAVSHG